MPDMDIVLERVQNKFACIIGELCSEPVVLSKFAIWLDLRLAEYKAKGAISLDCSGESPDPVWLKGHEKPIPVVKRSDDVYSPRNRVRPTIHEKSIQKSRPPESPAYEDDDRLSPGVVVIKEEATDETPEIFPISIHRVQPGNQNLNTRKRSLPESLAQAQDSFSNLSPSKIRHVDDRSTTVEGVDNQSLMSIIQEAEDDNHSSNVTDSDFSVLMSSNQGTSGPSRGDNSLTFSPQNSSAPLHYSSSPSTSADDSSSVQQMMSFQSTQGELSFSQDTGQSPGMSGDVQENDELIDVLLAKRKAVSLSVRSRIPNLRELSYVTVKHLVGSIATLEAWLKMRGENRNTEDIPPEELDPLLVDFFTNVKKLDGGDYDPTSFCCLRSYIERFLSDRDYKHSLRKSPLFAQSHHAYQIRRRYLPVKQKKMDFM